jgi:hypothetical protein
VQQHPVLGVLGVDHGAPEGVEHVLRFRRVDRLLRP